MRSEFMGENATLTTLFGADIDQDIREIAIETGLPFSTVKNAVSEYAPELLGQEGVFAYPGGAPEAPKGSTFGNVFKAIAEGIGQAAPGIAAAVRGPGSAPVNMQQGSPQMDLSKLVIPAGLGIILLLLLMKKK